MPDMLAWWRRWWYGPTCYLVLCTICGGVIRRCETIADAEREAHAHWQHVRARHA